MKHKQLSELVSKGIYLGKRLNGKLIETHISWVILTGTHVFKIKKPIRYSFLDFSTLEKRKYYCQKEVELNQRLSDIYLDVIPVSYKNGHYYLGEEKGELVEYAVRMKQLEASRRMDILLEENQLTPAVIKKLAEKVASFHREAEIISAPFSILVLQSEYNDLLSVRDWTKHSLGNEWAGIIRQAITMSDHFLTTHKKLFEQRVRKKFRRDVHGDLHARNIFIYEEPVIFDCIEFNDAFRRIDLLNEVAFFCMDLDAFGKEDFSRYFMKQYLAQLPCLENMQDRQLFIYYKSYRANVRAKVNALRAMQADDAEKLYYQQEVQKYLLLLKNYLDQIAQLQ